MVPKKSGLQLVIDERMEQINKHGYEPEHDDKLTSGELIFRASCYLSDNAKSPELKKLIKAGALIAAEIDRLLRIEEQIPDPSPVEQAPTPMSCQGKDSAKCIGQRCTHYPDKHDQDEHCTTPGICGYSCLPSGDGVPIKKPVFHDTKGGCLDASKLLTKNKKQVVCPLGELCVVGACSHKEKHDVKDGCFEGNKLCPSCVPVEEEVDQADEPEWMSLERWQPIIVWDCDSGPMETVFFSSYNEGNSHPVNAHRSWMREREASWRRYRLLTETEMDTIGLDKNRWKYTKD